MLSPATVKFTIVSVLPSTSESLVSRLPVRVRLAKTVASSATPIGASLTAVTVTVSVAVEVAVPSDTVTVATGATPFQSATGVKV